MDRDLKTDFVVLHFPETEEGMKELEKRISKIYADTVLKHIQKLNCSTEEKNRMLEEIIKEVDG